MNGSWYAKDPKGGKRPADVIGNAVHVIQIATGEIEDDAPSCADPMEPHRSKRGAGRIGSGRPERPGGQATARNLS